MALILRPEDADEHGLVAIGGDLRPATLLRAYRSGIFPWFSEGDPILWWSPDPRAALFPARLKIARSLRKTLKRRPYRITLDCEFRAVMQACAAPRTKSAGTWITREMVEAYCVLHTRGYAHSVEAWRGGELVGGLYGVALGGAFFGESMFSHATDASKVALVHLVRQLDRWGFRMIDCQLPSPHLFSLGAEEIRRREFMHLLDECLALPERRGRWEFDPDLTIIKDTDER